MQLSISERSGFVHLNEYKVIKYINEGQQSHNYLIETVNIESQQKELVFLQVLQDKQEDVRRLSILKELKGMSGVPQMKFYWYNPIIINSIQNTSLIDQRLLNGKIFIFYEYCFYPQLSKTTFEHLQFSSTQDLISAKMDLFFKICQILQQLNQKNIYHFDIQPENILTDGKDVQIIDFGAAQQLTNLDKCKTKDEKYKTFTYIQTPAFSPYKYDVQNCEIQADKYDVYSLGCILYFILTKQYLFQPLTIDNQNSYELQNQFGWEIFTLIQQMTEVDLMYRFTIDDVINHPIFDKSQKKQTKIININTKYKITYQRPTKYLHAQLGIDDSYLKSISTNYLCSLCDTHFTKIYSVQENLCAFSEDSDIPNTEMVEQATYIRLNTIKYYLLNGIKKFSTFKKKNSQYISRSHSNQYSSENIITTEQHFDDTYVEKIRNQLNNKVNVQLKYFLPDYAFFSKQRKNTQQNIEKLNQQQKDFYFQVETHKKMCNYIHQYLPQQIHYISVQKEITNVIYHNDIDYKRFISQSSDSEEAIYTLSHEESKLSKNASQILQLIRRNEGSIVGQKSNPSSKNIQFEDLDELSDLCKGEEIFEDGMFMSTSYSSHSLRNC